MADDDSDFISGIPPYIHAASVGDGALHPNHQNTRCAGCRRLPRKFRTGLIDAVWIGGRSIRYDGSPTVLVCGSCLPHAMWIVRTAARGHEKAARCTLCEGWGRLDENEPCPKCEGTGTVAEL